MAAVCETLQQVQSDDSEAGALDDLLGLGGALADASDDDNDALVDDAFCRRARGAGASVSVRGDNRRGVDDAEVDAVHAHRDGGTQQPPGPGVHQSASHATRDTPSHKREQRQATARSPPQLRLGLDDGPSAQRRLPL